MSRVLPILFNTDMVRAILDGRKTVTRRVIKPQPKFKLCYTFAGCNYGTWSYPNDTAHEYWGEEYKLPDCIIDEDKKIVWNPPYHTGDILYVRETWRVGAWDIRNQMIAFDYKDGTCGELTYIHDRELFERLVNQSREDARKAKCKYNGVDFIWKKGKSPCRWHPSLHMPKEAARIWLKVTYVRVERLQEITEHEAEKEGFCDDVEYCMGNTARGHFAELWNHTIKKSDIDRYGWDANPWVWVIEFERCGKP